MQGQGKAREKLFLERKRRSKKHFSTFTNLIFQLKVYKIFGVKNWAQKQKQNQREEKKKKRLLDRVEYIFKLRLIIP